MWTIEQAIFSVSRKDMPARIALCGKSAGIFSTDLGEIMASAKSFQVPQDGRFDLLNLFFHHLPSGSFAIGRLIPAMEPGQRQRRRLASFHLQYMVVDPKTFFCFGNNPVFVYQQLLNCGLAPFHADTLTELQPIAISHAHQWFDHRLMAAMADYPGPAALGFIAQTALRSMSMIFTGGPQAIHVVSTIFNLFPLRFRPELTFSSGLYFSPDRYFRIIAVSDKNPKPASVRDFCPVPYLKLDQLARQPELIMPKRGWGRFIAVALEEQRFDFLQAKMKEYDLETSRKSGQAKFFIPSVGELDSLGDTWLREMTRTRRVIGRPPGGDRKEIKKTERTFRLVKKTPVLPEDLPEQAKRPGFGTKAPGTPNIPNASYSTDGSKSTESSLPPLSISEKLKRWLLASHADETILHFRDQAEGTDEQLPNDEEMDSKLRDLFMASENGSTYNLSLDKQELLNAIEADLEDRQEYRENSPDGFGISKGNRKRFGIESGEQTEPRRNSMMSPLVIQGERGRIFSPFQRLMAAFPKDEHKLAHLDVLVADVLNDEFNSPESLRIFWRQFSETISYEEKWSICEEYACFTKLYLASTLNGMDATHQRINTISIMDIFMNADEAAETAGGKG